MEMAHGFNQSWVLDWEGRMSRIFLEELPAQETTHKSDAAGVEPDPLQGEPFRMRDGQNIESEIDEMHQPGPGTNRYHVRKNTFHIDPQQRQERNEKMTKDDDDPNPKPGAALPHHVPKSLFRHIAVPNDEILCEVNVSVKYGESEKQRAEEIVLVLVKYFREDTLPVQDHGDDVGRR